MFDIFAISGKLKAYRKLTKGDNFMIQFQNKRLFFAAFLLFFSVLLTGCTSKEEKAIRQTIHSELDHLVSPDATQINTYLSFQLLFPDAQQDDSSDLDPSITEIFTEFYKNFSYKISEVSYDDKSASADVIIHNLDTHALAKDYAIAALKKRIEGDANPSQVDFSLSDSYLLLDKTLKSHDYKQVESDIKVQLKKKNNVWEIVEDTDFDNELSGNFLTYMSDSNLLSPKQVVKIHFDTIKKFDAEQLNRYLSLDSLLNTDNTYTSSIAHALAEQIHKSFDYKIKSDSIENNSAKVVVKITSTDFTSILETYQKQISEWVQSSDALEAGLIGRHEKGREFLLKAIQDNTATTSETVEISLTNDGTSWKMQMDQNLAQAILGGVSSTLADVQEDVE